MSVDKRKRELAEPTLTRPVPHRQPRLVWHGWDAHPPSAPTSSAVVELVRPRLDHPGDPNRLIWAHDNLAVLDALLDEREGEGGYRYRGKVDLVYIDPPFMVQADFVARGSVALDPDDPAEATMPSRVAITAYRDTWAQGLDAFLSMLRARLVRLAQLLAPTGSLYVHLDWHAVHYVKVMMDEIFGYENFVNEVIWRRQTAHSDLAQGAKHFGRAHDTLLVYRASPDAWIADAFTPYEADYVASHYRNVDESGRRFQFGDITGPGGAAKGNAFYTLMGHAKHWRFSQAKAMEMVRQGRIVQPRPGAVPRQKRYLDEMPGTPLQDVWSDIHPINSQAKETLGYPTQKPLALLERIIATSCPPGGLVLDCFAGSGTTLEASERLGRRWIGIDSSKLAVHLARKRLIHLHDQPRSASERRFTYVECERCKTIERKPEPTHAPSDPPTRVDVRPFLLEHARPGSTDPQPSHRALAVSLRAESSDRLVRVYLEGCEIDVESVLAGQSAAERERLATWLTTPSAWRAFVDGWAIDWHHGAHVGPEGAPILASEWHALRVAKRRGSSAELAFVAEHRFEAPGRHRIAARVSDVFGNAGIASVEVELA